MSASQRIEGSILTPFGFVAGLLEHHEGRILSIEGEVIPEARIRDGSQQIVLPGFVDTHVHGGGGCDTMECGNAIHRIARTHARYGTTSLLATTMTAPMNEIEGAMRAIAPFCHKRPQGTARVLGVHLEGPYINPDKLGAQPNFTRLPSIEEILSLHALAPIRLVTLAPELSGVANLIAPLHQAGFRIQIGHTDGTYEDGVAALEHGASGFTHLFNAMTGLHHRAPGIVGAALAHTDYAEIIPDLVHVHPGAIRIALRAVPRLFCVTDSTAAAGMPDGVYKLGRHSVTKCLGGVRLADGTLAGSTLTMDQALRNLVSLGLSIEEASHRTATHAASYLGLPDRGRLAKGTHADITVFDRDLQLKRVIVEGEEIDLADD